MNEVNFDPTRIYTGSAVRATLFIPYIYGIRMNRVKKYTSSCPGPFLETESRMYSRF